MKHKKLTSYKFEFTGEDEKRKRTKAKKTDSSFSQDIIKALEDDINIENIRNQKLTETSTNNNELLKGETFLIKEEPMKRESSRKKHDEVVETAELIEYVHKRNQTSSSRDKRKNSFSLFTILDTKYRGCFVNVLIEGAGIVSGEVVLNFDKVLALKNNNTIVFINAEYIVAFY